MLKITWKVFLKETRCDFNWSKVSEGSFLSIKFIKEMMGKVGLIMQKGMSNSDITDKAKREKWQAWRNICNKNYCKGANSLAATL